MSKSDFKILIEHLLSTYRQFCLNRRMHRKIKTKLYRRFPTTWDTILISLENDFMLGLAKAFEGEKWFKNISRSDNHKDVINKIETLRDELYAHLDTGALRNKQDFLSTNKIKEKEVSALFNALIYSVDQLKRNFNVDQDFRELFIQVKEKTQDEFDVWLVVFQNIDSDRDRTGTPKSL